MPCFWMLPSVVCKNDIIVSGVTTQHEKRKIRSRLFKRKISKEMSTMNAAYGASGCRKRFLIPCSGRAARHASSAAIPSAAGCSAASPFPPPPPCTAPVPNGHLHALPRAQRETASGGNCGGLLSTRVRSAGAGRHGDLREASLRCPSQQPVTAVRGASPRSHLARESLAPQPMPRRHRCRTGGSIWPG